MAFDTRFWLSEPTALAAGLGELTLTHPMALHFPNDGPPTNDLATEVVLVQQASKSTCLGPTLARSAHVFWPCLPMEFCMSRFLSLAALSLWIALATGCTPKGSSNGHQVSAVDAAAAQKMLKARGAKLNNDDLSNVTRITLDHSDVTDDDLKLLKAIPQLTHLRLSDTGIGDAGLAHLATLTKLRVLKIDKTKVSGQGLKHLAPLTHLTELYMAKTALTDEGLVYLEPFKELRTLRISANAVGTSGGMSHVGKLLKLRSLDVSSTQIGVGGLEMLTPLVQLEKLNLYDTPVTDKGMSYLSHLKKLRWVNLDKTKITDEGLMDLAHLKNIEWLHLGRNQSITDGCFNYLLAFPMLKEVTVTRTAVTEAKAEEFRQGKPGIKVISQLPSDQAK